MNILLADDIEMLLKGRNLKQINLFGNNTEDSRIIKKVDPLTPLIYNSNGREKPVFKQSYGTTQKFFSKTISRKYPTLKELLNLAICFRLDFEPFIGLVTKLLIEELFFGLLLREEKKGKMILHKRDLNRKSIYNNFIEKLSSVDQNKNIFSIKTENPSYSKKDSEQVKDTKMGSKIMNYIDYSGMLKNMDFEVLKGKISYNPVHGIILENESDNVLVSIRVLSDLKLIADSESYFKKEFEVAVANPFGFFNLIQEMLQKSLFKLYVASDEFKKSMHHQAIILDELKAETAIFQGINRFSLSICNRFKEDYMAAMNDFFENIFDAVIELNKSLKEQNRKIGKAELILYDDAQTNDLMFEIRFEVKIPNVGITKGLDKKTEYDLGDALYIEPGDNDVVVKSFPAEQILKNWSIIPEGETRFILIREFKLPAW